MDFKTDDFKSALFEYLKENLTLDVATNSEYIGSMGDGCGNLYRDSHTLTVMLEDEVIATAYLG